jgi:hypothetical protein
MKFVKLHETFANSNPLTLESLKQAANIVGHMLITNSQQSIDQRQTFFSIKKNMYDTLVVLPTLLYTTILTKQIEWISEKAHDYHAQSKKMFHQSMQLPTLRSTMLSTQEQYECITYMHSFIQKQSFTTIENIVSAYILFRSVGIITSPHKKNLLATQELISEQTVKIVSHTKERIISFTRGSLYSALQSPFPVKKELFNQIFAQLNSVYTLEPLILLLKETHNHNLALCIQKDYEQIDLAIHAIHNAFEVCATMAKTRAEKENTLTSVYLLQQLLERCSESIKTFMLP